MRRTASSTPTSLGNSGSRSFASSTPSSAPPAAAWRQRARARTPRSSTRRSAAPRCASCWRWDRTCRSNSRGLRWPGFCSRPLSRRRALEVLPGFPRSGGPALHRDRGWDVRDRESRRPSGSRCAGAGHLIARLQTWRPARRAVGGGRERGSRGEPPDVGGSGKSRHLDQRGRPAGPVPLHRTCHRAARSIADRDLDVGREPVPGFGRAGPARALAWQRVGAVHGAGRSHPPRAAGARRPDRGTDEGLPPPGQLGYTKAAAGRSVRQGGGACVPGVTSALAAGESIGVPVTLRGIASSVAITTAQGTGSMSRLRDLAAATDTLVVMMARTNLTEVTAAIASVVGRERPAALVSKATWTDQRSVEGPIGDIARIADSAHIDPPATLIVGDVVTALTVSGLQLAAL